MTSSERRMREIEALRQLIERCGADRTRWPAPERLRFAALLKEDAEARRMLREASAFDRLLDMAPVVSETRHADLAERIVARALAAGREGAAPAMARPRPPEIELAPSAAVAAPAPMAANVSDLQLARERKSARADNWRVPLERSSWPVAALLAASLLIGIFAGSAGVFPEVGLGFAGVAASDTEFDGRALALGPDMTPDEDTL